MKSCMSRTMKAGALGIKTSVSGRLGGADGSYEFYSEGTIPLRYLEQTSIMDSQKQTQLTEKLVLKYGFIKVKFFQQKKLRKGAINSYVNAKKSKTL